MTDSTPHRDTVAGNTPARADGTDTPTPGGTAPGGAYPDELTVAGQPLLSEGGFVGVARLELDELLVHLIDRATDVQQNQGRLRGLLRANMQVARAVDLEEVLTHILDAAQTLVGARYAALGVIEDDHDHGQDR